MDGDDSEGDDSEDDKCTEFDIDKVPRVREVDQTLLHVIALGKRRREPMRESKMSSIVSLLLDDGLSIDAVDDKSQTPLHLACCTDNPLAVSILLHHGASLGAQDSNGCTPMMRIIQRMRSFVVSEQFFKKASIADIVRRNKFGHSILSYLIGSIGYNDPDMAMLLLNTVDLRAARELGTQESDEFVELTDILKRIGCDGLIGGGDVLWEFLYSLPSQRSLISCLQYIAENVDVGNLDWCDSDIEEKIRKECGSPELASPDTTTLNSSPLI